MQLCLRWIPAPACRGLQPLAVVVVLALTLIVSAARGAEAGSGVLSGTVSNTATGNLLQGAKIEVLQLGLAALTDNTGRYVLSGLPAGTLEVVVSYTGLDTQRRAVPVVAGQRAAQNFDLTTGIYQMQEFKVVGEREGGAAAITMQRNADNVKNVVAMDSFGNLPNMSAGELAIRLPGVAGQLDEEGNVTGVIVRGMASTMNRVTVDGGLITNVGGMNRQFQTHSLTGAMFEQLEVIKGHRPDTGADSLGGTINLKTRSSLSMREKRRVSYSASARWAPPFTEQIPLREEHRLHPLFNFSYQEVFDVFGGNRNLGVAVNTFYSENVAGYFRTIRDFQNVTSQPAYLWDYRNQDAFNNRKQGSLNVKMDYRFSPTTKFSLNTIYNDASEPYNRLYETRAFTGGSTTAMPVYLKSGFDWREQMAREVNRQRRWNYLGTSALPSDPSLGTWGASKTGLNVPQWETAAFIKEETPVWDTRSTRVWALAWMSPICSMSPSQITAASPPRWSAPSSTAQPSTSA